jgi:hypothetical protein
MKKLKDIIKDILFSYVGPAIIGITIMFIAAYVLVFIANLF